MNEHRIRVAVLADFDRLVEVEMVADGLFGTAGIGPLPPPNLDPGEFGKARRVLVAGDPAYGFARIEEADGGAHLEQLSVHPDRARTGAGGALLEAACSWAADAGYGAMTLCTFADVPWNGPFYARHGFAPIAELGPDLRALRETEARIGLDGLGTRVVMRRVLAETGDVMSK